MTFPRPFATTLFVAAAFSLAPAPTRLRADEGMWLFNAPPTKQLKERYNFEPDAAWLNHLQKASVRFNSGGSGSFVSADGLVITNHHVGADVLQKIGDAQHNYMRDGFYAKTRGEEKRALDLELNVLVSIEDVTARVNAAIKPEMDADAALAARRSASAGIEKESKDKTGLRSDVVTLFQGGAYHLYRYKRYDDVRLVFAPEEDIAFYGGDPDNFEYPRFDLDICLFRVYENGQPARPDQFLKWSANGAADGELTFVSGHPGTTERQLTFAELTDLRDRAVPRNLARLYRRETLLASYAARADENARRVRDDLFGVRNNRKRYDGFIAGLLDPEVQIQLQDREARLRKLFSENEKLNGMLAAFEHVARAQSVIAMNSRQFDYFEGARRGTNAFGRHAEAFNSTLFRIARVLVRAGEERTKPNGERLPEYRDSAKDSLELQLFSTEPLYDDLERLTLTDSLTDLAGVFGAGDPLVATILAGKSPADRAAELVNTTKLKDVAFRKQLYEGGTAAVNAAQDPFLDLVRSIDDTARAARRIRDAQDEVKAQAHAQIGAAEFAASHGGAGEAPDATFTLRLSYGPVAGYEENGTKVPAFTTMAGLYQRSTEHGNREPFTLPPRWTERKARLKLDTPFNFVCTADIVGGNSGSPVVNQAAEFVGIIFDGNIQSLSGDYIYSEKQARAVSVDSRAIIEALRNVYDAGPLADELVGARK